MNTAICRAIIQRDIVRLNYDGTVRTVEPHAHGVSTVGNEVLRAFQVSGFSRSGKAVAWKLFLVSKIYALRATGETFSENRPDYNPNDEAMTVVHCHV